MLVSVPLATLIASWLPVKLSGPSKKPACSTAALVAVAATSWPIVSKPPTPDPSVSAPATVPPKMLTVLAPLPSSTSLLPPPMMVEALVPATRKLFPADPPANEPPPKAP